MLLGSSKRPYTPEKFFRGVNGTIISLDETTDSSHNSNNSGIIKFVLRNNRKLSLCTNCSLVIFTAVVCTGATPPAILLAVSVAFVALQYKYFLSSANIATSSVLSNVPGEGISGWQRNYETRTPVSRDKTREKMPGIHVRSLGKLDWVERGNEPVLTVPGAYWLCHKKHIYKFTFKWHKTLRNAEGFAYPKELTKVIRRIIKSQPRQGQQFGTRHLLVTYNHSAWMRQDKMFAMLKFQDRSEATAFPHAFVLTVKTIDGLVAEETRSAHLDKDRTLTLLEDVKKAHLQDTRQGKNEEIPQDDSQDTQSAHRSSDSRSKDEIEIFAQLTHVDKHTEEACSSLWQTESDRKKDLGKKSSKRRRSFNKIEASPLSKKQNRKESTTLENKEMPANLLAGKEIPADSADLPYQYIIEKEIENSKSAPEPSSPGPSHRDSLGKFLLRSPRIASSDITRSADITDLVMEGLMFTIRQDQDSVTVVEQKTKLEMDEVLENSEKVETKEGEKCLLNSSLLRLENLITKIETSEAKLKINEEKPKSPLIGHDRIFDKPLSYNSSFTSSEYSTSRAKFDTKNVRNVSPFEYKVSSLSPQPTTNAESSEFPLVKINLRKIRDVLDNAPPLDLEVNALNRGGENDGIKLNVDKKKEIRASNICNETEEEEDEVRLELKYDDKDEEEPEVEEVGLYEAIDPETLQENQQKELLMNYSETKDLPEHDPSSTPIKDCIEAMKSKTPRIVSNEIVTDDQIPPELQKALRHKRTHRLFHSEIENNIVKDANRISTEARAPKIEVPAPLSVKEEALRKKPEQKTEEVITIDVTEEFERELLSEKPCRQSTRRKSLRKAEYFSSEANQAVGESEIHIEMWKFIQDITRGAKVVVHRLDLANIPNSIVTDSFLQKYNSSRRYATES